MDIVKDPKLLFVALLVVFFIGATINTAGDAITDIGGDSTRGEVRGDVRGADSTEVLFTDIGDISPYTEQISLKRARAKDDDPKEEYLEIHADRKNAGALDITGWTLTSRVSGGQVTIDTVTAIPVYRGYNAEDSRVLLAPNHTAYIITSGSPIGTSFRTNSCIGYLQENKAFSPNLSRQCPDPADEDLEKYGIDPTPRDGSNDELCLRELKSINSCENPGGTDDELSRDCREYIDMIDYNWCAELHVAEEDFLGDEWYIYLGYWRGDIWDDDHEIIELRDSAGRMVDTIEY